MTAFWRIVGSNSVRSASEVQSALEQVSGQLRELDPDGLVQFEGKLREAPHTIDRRELAEIPVSLAGGLELPQTSDHFLYARCACILSGQDAYDAVLLAASEFSRFVRPYAQAAEELLYLASGTYEKKVGEESSLKAMFPLESTSNVQGWTE
ncbi:uncharacterized protein DUF4240 [Kribbella amoyensis]|uniref:Uncharacterized protein DUF4240 n=1 Tax=Kribbella amoyensis TaxID=996641 RepID=A0A561B8T7_9ACTN|nr:DUF4240 domain-containing protein [Kribbella amoyensis]TWD75375.1 uncharacterized protein DUF4240 [Kribbella amoyensis]